MTTVDRLNELRVFRVTIVRCPLHGIAYDAELESCPECAKGAS